MKYPIQVLFREYFEGILAAIFLALFLRFFVLNILYIPTDNMEPTLKRGDFVLGFRLSYGFPLPLMKGERLNLKVPFRGDLISFRFPGDEEQILIRRVVGLPGDLVKIEGGAIFINGEMVPSESLSEGIKSENLPTSRGPHQTLENEMVQLSELTVPRGQLFVLSDNRLRKDDSRDWGFVPLRNVESRICLIWLSVDNSEEGVSIIWPRLMSWVQ